VPQALVPVDGGVALAGLPLMGYGSDFDFNTSSSGCAFDTGADRVFSVPVPAGQRLSVSATTNGDIAVNIVQSAAACMATPLVCSAVGDVGFGGMPETETARWDNASSTTQTAVVIVESHDAMPAPFDLSVAITRPPYLMTAMSSACDNLAAVTTTPQLTSTTTPALGDDVTTMPSALPFAFTYFGRGVTHFSVSSNGFLQLYTSATGTPASAASNDAIPVAGSPDGVVAPFWDDLTPQMGTTSSVVSAVLGSGSTRHLTVQWTSMELFSAAGSAVTVQAKLYETTNVIELSACTLTPGTDPADVNLEKGLSATVGIENTDGDDAVRFSYNAPSLVAGQTVRLVP
jgi:hypothetical protein